MELYGFTEISGSIDGNTYLRIKIDVRQLTVYHATNEYVKDNIQKYNILVDGVWIKMIDYGDMIKILKAKKSFDRDDKISEIIE